MYTWQDAYVSTIGPDELLALTHTDELNGEDSVDIATTFALKQGYRLVWADRLGEVHEHVCQDPKGLHAGGDTVYTDTAINSICETYGDYIEDKRPYGYGFLQALNVCLEPTRWTAGTVDQPGTVDKGLTFYHTNSRESLKSILECGGELETEIAVSGGKVSSRKVGIRSHRGAKGGHRRFTYTKDLASVSRTEHYGAITACYGYGKGIETDTGGYGRKLTFGEINNGKNYVEDATALKLYGRPDGRGGHAHVFGQYENSNCEDAATLLAETRAYLDSHKEPGMTYEADAVDLVQFGREWEGVAVGDDVQIVDTCFSPALRCEGRVTKLVTDELGGSMRVTLGNVTETITDMLLAQQQKVSSLSKRSSSWDVAASTPPSYLQQVMDAMNTQFNMSGSSYTFTSFEQGTIYASVPMDANGRSTTGKGSAMQLCSQGFRIASGCKADGSWDWRTFGTGAGFTADLITVGTLMGDLIKAGTIQDRSGKNYWNLDESEVHLGPGAKLDGKDIAVADAVIASVDVEYAQGASRVTEPQSGWQTTAPQWVSGKYIWTRTKTTMQSGDIEYSEPVCISGRDGVDGANGADGKDGARGPAGKDGVSTYFHRAYATSADGRQGFSTSYGSGKTYLGTYVDSVKADSTDPAKYQWSLIKGADGEDGVPGKNGTDGKTYYLHIAYATNADGKQGFSVSYGAGKTYIGQCVDLNVKDPTDPSAYTWSKIKGETGTGVSGIVEQYYLSTSSTAQSGGSWSEAQPAWSKGKYIWTRSKVAWTDGSTTYTAPCLAKAINGSNQMAGSAIAARVKLYAKNQSDSVPPINAQNPELGWSEDLPQWSNGYFVWSMERVTYGDGSVTHTAPVLEAAYNKAYQSAHDLTGSLNGLDTTVQDLARDGVVTEAEAAAVKKAKQDVDKEREELTSQYNALKSNKALSAQFLSSVLGPRYTKAFGTTDEGGTYGAYTDKVDKVLMCKTAEELKDAMYEYDAAYGAYSTAVKDYADAATGARHAIEQKNASDYADGILSAYDEQMDQKALFDRLTKGGTEQGIYMQNDRVYINASYMATGTIADAKGRSSWNLKEGVLNTNYMTAKNITASGTFSCGGSSYYTKLNNVGQMEGYRTKGGASSTSRVGYIDFSSSMYDKSDGTTRYGLQLQAEGSVRISSPKISVRATSDTSVTTFHGSTGKYYPVGFTYPPGEGWDTANLVSMETEFINGICIRNLG
ncbi:phage tail protein [Collinsella aerofaciens]|uniref:phage tail protein n=1 Tax=Collinsella TaxID=102106 RepID=UPI001C23A299|nr:phage tail protein [Collinsella aerofaciens]MBU9062366.1 phage tail protein [Collinsella sp. MSK.8.10]MCB5367481.1 phage tail protein [Collinsella aerofaciens]